jgi:hypothetical protein
MVYYHCLHQDYYGESSEMTAEIVDACAAMLLVGRVGEQVSIDIRGDETASAQQIVGANLPASGLFYVSKISGLAQLATLVLHKYAVKFH